MEKVRPWMANEPSDRGRLRNRSRTDLDAVGTPFSFSAYNAQNMTD